MKEGLVASEKGSPTKMEGEEGSTSLRPALNGWEFPDS